MWEEEVEMVEKIGDRLGELCEMVKDFYEVFLKNHGLKRGLINPNAVESFGHWYLTFLTDDCRKMVKDYEKFRDDYFLSLTILNYD